MYVSPSLLSPWPAFLETCLGSRQLGSLPQPIPDRISDILQYMPVSVKGTKASEWDRDTWRPLEDLARNHPEAGVHFQGRLENRVLSGG